MKKIIIALGFIMLFTSLVSANIIISQQPKNLYNLGDVINLPLKIATSEEINDFLSIKLVCNGKETEIHKEYITLSAGEEKTIGSSMPLIESLIGRSTGTCKIKSMLGEEYILTNEFKISNLITINLKKEQIEFAPEETIMIEGDSIKENGGIVEGFVDIIVSHKDSEEKIEISETVKNGYFFANLSLSKEAKAGQYLVQINVYEKGFDGNMTNQGLTSYEISVTQIPTSLEIVFEDSKVDPGTNLKVKAILHDQTGEKIESTAVITIKNENNKILEQLEKPTDEFLEFPIAYNQIPMEWTAVAISNKLTSESMFEIKEKEKINIEMMNKTVIITNTGNVPYNKNVLIKIGEESLNINVSLDVNEEQKYLLTAPDGEYQVEIITDGQSQISESVLLTGKAINVKEVSRSGLAIITHPFVWIFIIAILGFITVIVFKKGYKKSFFGYIRSKKKEKKEQLIPTKKDLIESKNKANLSLSIKGNKQNINLICLKIKNLKEILSQKNNVKETLQKIAHLVEGDKGIIYETHDTIFFMILPTKTKTFQNEKITIVLSQKIKELLNNHNKLFKQKIEFGISLNYGTIIFKEDAKGLKFMSMGTLITTAKKIASLSSGETLLSEKIKSKLGNEIKTEKQKKGETAVYTIKEIKDTEKYKKFIDNFLKNLEK